MTIGRLWSLLQGLEVGGERARTRHLRIRASCLSEALKAGELTLSHRMGSSLWADGLTKPLPAQHLSRFCEGVWLGGPSLRAEVQGRQKQVQVINNPVNAKVLKAVSLLTVGAALLPGAQAAEVCEAAETKGSWADQGWILVLAGLVCILHLVKDLGWELLKRLLSKEDSLKVTLLNDQASLPVKATAEAAGWDLASSVEMTLRPGERRLVPLGLSLEVP